ncbi:MAG: hypothetical protein ACJ76N_23665 [Thermoanaerobaculia bacterium]
MILSLNRRRKEFAMRYPPILVSLLMASLHAVGTAQVASQQTTNLEPLHLTKVSHQSTVDDVLLDFSFNSDVSQRLAEFTCECTRMQARGGDVSPLAPRVVAGETPTTVRVRIAKADIVSTNVLECTLSQTSPGGHQQNVLTAGIDLTLRRELAQTKTELFRCSSGLAIAQKPVLREVIAFPEHAVIRLLGNPSGRYRVQAKAEGEEPRISNPSVPGSPTHEVKLGPLTPGKTYDLEYWQLSDKDKAIARTTEKSPGGLKTPKAAAEVTFSNQHVKAVEAGIIVEAATNVPALVSVDTREYNPATGTAGAVVPGKEFLRDEYGRPPADALQISFRVPLRLQAGQMYQYRLRAINADGVESPPTQWDAQDAVKGLPVLDFTSPIEVAVTPVGFVVTWTANDPEYEAVLTVDDGDESVDVKRKSPGPEVSLALGTVATSDFLKAMIAPRNDKIRPKLIVEMHKTVATLTGQETRSVRREMRIALPQEKAETRTLLDTLALSPTEKAKLIAVAEKTINTKAKGLKFNWNQVFGVALRLLLGGT